jgi:ABC-type antimicrobial peptide transport system permease subunit
VRGRLFRDDEDVNKPNVVVINEALAKKYFPGEEPIGQKIGDDGLTPKSVREIIGVVSDVREGELDSEMWPTEYLSINQMAGPDSQFVVVARTSQDEHSLLPVLVSTMHQINPNVGTYGETTMADQIGATEAALLHRFSTWLVGGFAAMALLLGVVGLYGVIAYSVSQRTREIGVRMALGAQRGAVYRMVLTEAARLIAVGGAAGMAGAVGAATLMRKLLFGVQAWDGATLAAVATVLAIAALLASYFPARRAASVNPTDALRAE